MDDYPYWTMDEKERTHCHMGNPVWNRLARCGIHSQIAFLGLSLRFPIPLRHIIMSSRAFRRLAKQRLEDLANVEQEDECEEDIPKTKAQNLFDLVISAKMDLCT